MVNRIRFHVNRIKKEKRDYLLEEAIDRAIEDLPKDFKIFEFILANRMEVKDMCLFEYDEKNAMEAEREEGRAEGRLRVLIELVLEKTYTVEQAAKKANLTVDDFQKILDAEKTR